MQGCLVTACMRTSIATAALENGRKRRLVRWNNTRRTRPSKLRFRAKYWRASMNINMLNGQISLAQSSLHDIEVTCKTCLQESRRVLREVREEPSVFLKEWRERQVLRREVSRLLSVAPHMIADIGLTLDEAS